MSFTVSPCLFLVIAAPLQPELFEYAKEIGAATVAVTCNPDSELSHIADLSIAPVVGPEVVTGSTRMKAGTAQKLVLNMLSTGAMIKTGKVFGNLMVDVRATNKKLVERAKGIVVEATGASREDAEKVLEETTYNVKLSILMLLAEVSKEEGEKLLKDANGHISKALKAAGK